MPLVGREAKGKIRAFKEIGGKPPPEMGSGAAPKGGRSLKRKKKGKTKQNLAKKKIKKKEDIATMRYVSAEEAWESYKKDVFQGNEELLEGFEGNNPLKESDSYEIT